MQVARNIAASVGQVLASALILFILYRTILEELGVDKLGIWSVVIATASASRIGEFGLSVSVTRFVAKYRALGDAVSAGQIVQTAVISIAVLLPFALLGIHPLLEVLFERIFSGGPLDEARELLPYALISFFLTAVASVFQSGLDGCQRFDWRALLMVSGQLLFLLSALWMVPSHGLIGLAWAHIGQGLMLIVVGWLLLRRFLVSLPWLPYQWRWVRFREMLGYGLQFQFGSIAIMLFEPLGKALMGKYGGLYAAGYYEMASQFVGKARLLIVSANQVLVPIMADLNENDPRQIFNVYRTNLRLLFFIVFPFYALVSAVAPLLSEFWIGYYEQEFVFFVMVLALAMSLNSFASPAYFSNLGTGRIFWNTAAHVCMGITNAGLGVLLGPLFGAAGVVWGIAVATICGSLLVVGGFHRQWRFSWDLFIPRESVGLLVASVSLSVISYSAYHFLAGETAMMRILVCVLLPLPVLGPVLWRHPLRPILQRRVQGILTKRASFHRQP